MKQTPKHYTTMICDLLNHLLVCNLNPETDQAKILELTQELITDIEDKHNTNHHVPEFEANLCKLCNLLLNSVLDTDPEYIDYLIHN